MSVGLEPLSLTKLVLLSKVPEREALIGSPEIRTIDTGSVFHSVAFLEYDFQ
jgi:hypothetical protein